jgi:hypothetical protein
MSTHDDDDPGVQLPRQADAEERYWAHRLEEFQAKSLSDIHAAAEKWAGTISSLVGIFGIAGLIKGRDEIDKLSENTKLAVAILVGIALLLAFIAIYKAAKAAQGVTSEVTTVAEFREKYEQAAKDAANNLNWSRRLVIPATLSLAVAVGVTWFGPAKDAEEKAAVVVVAKGGAASCGNLVDQGGSLSLETDTGVTPIRDAVSVTPVDACP